ncbi:MAG: hypothetical protein WCK64_00375 [Synechococcaceae cyanobacterium ELA445]|jgi:hypothetical protein
MSHPTQTQDGERLAHTALKWGADGELSMVDRNRILQLLCAVDPMANLLIDQLDCGAR